MAYQQLANKGAVFFVPVGLSKRVAQWLPILRESRKNLVEYVYNGLVGNAARPIKWEEQKNKKLITQKNNKSLGLHKTSAITLETLTSKYGIDDGTNRYAKYLEKQKYAHSKQSFLDKYGDTIGEQKWEDYLRSKDNTSLKSFIKRHGEEDGRIRYAENCKKCSTTLDNMILKFGVEEGTKRYTAKRLKAIAALSNVNTVSKISQRIFWDIYNVLHDSFKEYCRFAELNDESRFYFHKPKKINCYKIDFKCGKVIIEYNGKYWHRNTTEYDNIRKQDLESIGYTVIFISEDDIKKEIYNNTINNLKKIIHDKAFIKPK